MSCNNNRTAYFLPLAARLGELGRLVLAGQIAVGQWALVTSLVAAAELPVLLGEVQRAVLLKHVQQGA